MSSAAKERRKASRRDRRREKADKLFFKAAGLEWTSDMDIREQSFLAAFEALADRSGQFVTKSGVKALSAVVAASVINPAAGLALAVSLTKDVKDKFQQFRNAYNRAFFRAQRLKEQAAISSSASNSARSSASSEAPAPRKQIDFGTVGSTLPPQSVAMMAPKTSAMPPWVLPAFGLVAVAYVWSASK